MMGFEKYVPLAAIVLDSLIGDPRWAMHPVVLIGNLISIIERKLLHTEHSPKRKKWCGAILVLLVLGITYTVVWGLLKIFNSIHPAVGFTGGALILAFAITPRSLAGAGQEIKNYLINGDIVQARSKVGWIVGRDTQQLDEAEVVRATVETVAENIVDGIVAPLFYAAVGGISFAFMYRAANTLDSMVGYKNEKYIDFGKVAAKMDDVLNYIPARLTGALIVLAAILLRYNAYGAAVTVWRDAAKHPSPNSGIPEAGVAGALGIRLGGLNYYGGISSLRAYMGDSKTELTPLHIEQTINIMYMVTILFAVLMVLIQLVVI